MASAVPAVPVPELGLILAARAQPGLVVTCQVPGQDAGFEQVPGAPRVQDNLPPEAIFQFRSG